MLIRINIKNFLSIFDKQEFSMIAGKTRGNNQLLSTKKNVKILKYSSLYGANASGKSNLVKAINFSKNCITSGIKNSHGTENFCKLKLEYRDSESYFDYEIFIDNDVYSYGFTAKLSNEEITGEWLYKLSENKTEEIFSRDLNKKTQSFNKELFNTNNQTKFGVWLEDSMMQEDSLLLTEIFNKKNTDEQFNLFNNIYRWFRNKLSIIYPNTKYKNTDSFILNNNTLLEMLKKLDTGIKAIEQEIVDISEIPFIKKDTKFLTMIKNDLKRHSEGTFIFGSSHSLSVSLDKNDELLFKKIVFNHADTNTSILLDYSEESDGTRRIIELIQAIDLSQKEGRVLIIDEIERSLHPLLIESLLEYYLDSAEKFDSQLIITTHDQRLLNLKKIRKDSIWFVEKDYSGYSKFKSLDEYKTRNDLKIEKAYLEGRFGAVPIIDELNNITTDIET